MKTRVLLLVALICLPMLFVLSPPVTGEGPQLVITELQRNVHYEAYGMVFYTDTITVLNPGPEPAFSVLTAYPLSNVSKVIEFRAETVNGTALFFQRIPVIGTNCSGWQVFLPEPIMPDEESTFVAKMAIEGLTSQTTSVATIVFSFKPTSPYLIQSFETRLTYNYALTSASQQYWSGTNIHPYSYEEDSVVFDYAGINFVPLMTYVELKRQFSIDPWGYLFAHEVHTLRVDSPNPDFANEEQKWTNTTLILPPGSMFSRAYDQVGNLSSQIGQLANITHPGVVYVSFPYRIQEGDTFTFYFEYRIPLDQHQLVLQTGQFLSLDLYLEYPFRIERQKTEVLLPMGSWLQQVPLGAETTISPTGQYLISFLTINVTSLSQGEINLYYVYPLSPAFTRPLLLFLVIGMICLGYIAVRRIPYFREEEEAIAAVLEVDPAILSEFCALYGEKIALLLQTERLEQTMVQGKISKPRYRKEKKNFERKFRSLDRELAARKQSLIEAGGKYETSARQLELLEAERVSAVEALHALEQRYRQKRITASVYQKLRKDLEKRRDRPLGRMDRILLSLREEIPE